MSARKAPPALPFEGLYDFLERALSLPEPEWLIPGLVPAAGGLLIVAEPGVGKTWLALALAKLAGDRQVFIVEEEGGTRQLGERFRALAFPFGTRVSVLHKFGVLLDNNETFQALCAEVERAARPVLILDPLAAVMGGDENSTQDAGLFVQRLRALQRANPQLLLALLHHTSKAGSRGDGSPLYAARGSSQFTAWADVQLNLKSEQGPRGPGRVSFTVVNPKMRDAEESLPKTITLTLGPGDVEIAAQSEARSDEREQKVLEALANAEGPLVSVNALAKAVRGKRELILKAIAGLEERGDIRNDPIRGFEVVPVVPNGSRNQVVPGSHPLRGEPGTEGRS